MRLIFALTALAVLLPLPLLAEPPDEIPLHVAVQRREVRVNVVETSGYGKVLLSMQNCADKRRRLRLPGTYLRPGSGRYQRLSLGYSERTRSGTVTLASRGSWQGWVMSCCMDGGKASPDSHTSYAVCADRAPERIAKIMEHWAVNTKLSQSLINQYVWGSKTGDLPGTPPEKQPDRYEWGSARLFAWGGKLLVLFPGGDLFRLKDDGNWTRLGTGVDVVGFGWGRIVARFGEAVVREYNETERKWCTLGTLPGASTFLPAPSGTFATVGTRLFRYDHEGGWKAVRSGVEHACLSLDLQGTRLFAASTRAGGGCILKASGERMAWTATRCGGFTGVAATAEHLYGITRGGLVALTDRGYTRLSALGTFHPHRSGVFCLQADGKLREYRETVGIWYRHGSPGTVLVGGADPVTGDFYVLKNDGKVVLLKSGGSWKDLADLPEKEKKEEKEEGK